MDFENLTVKVSDGITTVTVDRPKKLNALNDETLTEMMRTAKDLMGAMHEVYRPHGFNVGFNVGEAAGAGIEEHLHLHVGPRWRGDNNMMTVVGETRVIPEDLGRTFEKMTATLAKIGEDRR